MISCWFVFNVARILASSNKSSAKTNRQGLDNWHKERLLLCKLCKTNWFHRRYSPHRTMVVITPWTPTPETWKSAVCSYNDKNTIQTDLLGTALAPSKTHTRLWYNAQQMLRCSLTVFLLRPYLEGTRSTIRSDHDSSKWIRNMSDASGMLASRRLHLSVSDVDIIHRPGVKSRAADALSSIKSTDEDSTDCNNDLPVAVIDLGEDQKEATKASPYTICHICDHNEQEPRKMKPEVKALV